MYLRYDWPLHFVLWVTNWLPDNVIFLHFRGWLARPFLGRCGKGLRLARNIAIHNPRNVRLGQHVFFAYGCLLLATDIIAYSGARWPVNPEDGDHDSGACRPPNPEDVVHIFRFSGIVVGMDRNQ